MFTVMEVRLYPNETQVSHLVRYLNSARYVFNCCLAIRRDSWKQKETRVTQYEQNALLTKWRAEDELLRSAPSQISRDAIRRVDLAFDGFFRRLKEGKGKAGYPRFKSANRYNSFAISSPGKVVYDGKIRVSRIGDIRCRNLRPIEGIIKVLRVVRRAGKWFAQLTIDDGKQTPEKRPVENAIGLDVGLNTFAVGSDGSSIGNPRFYRSLECKLRRVGRNVSRKKKGSKNRRKAVLKLQRVHERIRSCRSNFTHQISRRIIDQYDLIAVEKLNIKGMTQGRLAKSILDAAWGQLIYRLRYKAEKAGSQLVEVDPRGTTQECSQCGETVKKELSERIHNCPNCGLILCRDENAAINILNRATGGRPGIYACENRVSPYFDKAVVVEAGSSI